jgi:CheY-like chemotaxis protein
VIVDPHDDSRELYADYFEWAGIDVAVVPTADHALRMMCQEPPDAVITCLRLPAMDGFALCDALRTMPHTSRIPVIGLSSCRLEHDRAQGDARFASVLMKPFLPAVLINLLRELPPAETH